MGGGGYNGTLVTGLAGFTLQPANVDNPLKQGFVTSAPTVAQVHTGIRRQFALDDEALRNFGKESIKKGHDAAMEIIKKAYGRAPERFYFIGDHRAATRRSTRPRVIPTTTTASSRTIPPTTSRCCIWDR